MFTKRKRVGTAGKVSTAPIYRDVFDWEAFWGVIFWVVIGIGVLSLLF